MSHLLQSSTSYPSQRVRVGRIIVLLALIPIAALYLYPRIFNLVATPYRLDAAVEHANRYNPGLMQIVSHEEDTVAEFDALDEMNRSLASVRDTDAVVAAELKRLVDQISGDLQATLGDADASVGDMVKSLDGLSERVSQLHPPVDGASSAVASDRARMVKMLAEARATAAKVHTARVAADRSATNVSGN